MPDSQTAARLARLEAIHEIGNLQGRYNHYLQTGQIKDRLADLFAFDTPGVSAEMADSGEWRGRDGVMQLFRHLGTKYAMPGALMVHLLTTPVIEIMPDGETAKGMWNSFGANSFLNHENKLEAMWQLGKYDISFVRQRGQWRYLVFKWFVIFRTPYQDGWVKTPIVEGLHEASFPPPSPLHTPYDPQASRNHFPPFPPEPIPQTSKETTHGL